MIVTLDIPLALSDIAAVIGAPSLNTNAVIRRICTDSREAQPQDLFFALNGTNDNGEHFAEDAVRRGAYAVSTHIGTHRLCVRDTTAALGALAAWYLTQLPHVSTRIAVSGSVGKTTTKNMLCALLSPYRRTHATKGNFNNHIGVPLTILSAARDTELLICEIGISHPSDMAPLSMLVRPDIALLTNVGHAHIGNFGSAEQLVEEKYRITYGMSEHGQLLVPYEDVRLRTRGHAIGVSLHQATAPFYLACAKTSDQTTKITLFHKQKVCCTDTWPLVERGLLQDAAMAASAAALCGIPLTHTGDAMAQVIQEGLRMQRRISTAGVHLLDDAYNASPESMLEAIRVLCEQRTDGHRCVLLGDMLELGRATEQLHRMIGRTVAACGIDKAFFFGVYAPFYRLGAQEGGMPCDRIFLNNDSTDPACTAAHIREQLSCGDTLLCKASHGCHLERILALL